MVRAYILARLTNELGYKSEDIEIERKYSIGRKKKSSKARIDIIVKEKSSENIFLFIELKRPKEYEKNQDEDIENQLFKLAYQEKVKKLKYLILYSIEIIENKIND